MKDYDTDFLQTIIKIMAKELNWSNEQINAELNQYKKSWTLMHTWK
jgi:hypothetical protein